MREQLEETLRELRAARAGRDPPPPRTKWTGRVPHPVLIGHAASLSQVPYFEWPPEDEPARQVRARPQRHRGPGGAPPRC